MSKDIGITVLKEDGVANPSYRRIRREGVVLPVHSTTTTSTITTTNTTNTVTSTASSPFPKEE